MIYWSLCSHQDACSAISYHLHVESRLEFCFHNRHVFQSTLKLFSPLSNRTFSASHFIPYGSSFSFLTLFYFRFDVMAMIGFAIICLYFSSSSCFQLHLLFFHFSSQDFSRWVLHYCFTPYFLQYWKYLRQFSTCVIQEILKNKIFANAYQWIQFVWHPTINMTHCRVLALVSHVAEVNA